MIYTQSGYAARGNQSTWIWDSVHLAGDAQLGRVWLDIWAWDSGREEAVWSNWTYDPGITFGAYLIWDTVPDKKIHPTYINWLE